MCRISYSSLVMSPAGNSLKYLSAHDMKPLHALRLQTGQGANPQTRQVCFTVLLYNSSPLFFLSPLMTFQLVCSPVATLRTYLEQKAPSANVTGLIMAVFSLFEIDECSMLPPERTDITSIPPHCSCFCFFSSCLALLNKVEGGFTAKSFACHVFVFAANRQHCVYSCGTRKA